MELSEVFELVKQKKVIMGTFITRERLLQLTQAFMSDPQLEEVFVETEIRAYGNKDNISTAGRHES